MTHIVQPPCVYFQLSVDIMRVVIPQVWLAMNLSLYVPSSRVQLSVDSMRVMIPQVWFALHLNLRVPGSREPSWSVGHEIAEIWLHCIMRQRRLGMSAGLESTDVWLQCMMQRRLGASSYRARHLGARKPAGPAPATRPRVSLRLAPLRNSSVEPAPDALELKPCACTCLLGNREQVEVASAHLHIPTQTAMANKPHATGSLTGLHLSSSTERCVRVTFRMPRLMSVCIRQDLSPLQHIISDTSGRLERSPTRNLVAKNFSHRDSRRSHPQDWVGRPPVHKTRICQNVCVPEFAVQ